MVDCGDDDEDKDEEEEEETEFGLTEEAERGEVESLTVATPEEYEGDTAFEPEFVRFF